MIVGIICFAIGVGLGIVFEKTMAQYKERNADSRGRIGRMRYTCTGSGPTNKGEEYNFVVTLEELEQIGKLSKIKVLDVSGSTDTISNQVPQVIGEYIETDAVDWQEETNEVDNAE